MSVYTDLLKLGLNDESAAQLAEAAARPAPLTSDHLDKRLAELEARLLRTIIGTLLGMTALFSGIVGLTTWLLSQQLAQVLAVLARTPVTP